ncbi:MAG: tetratricopeptide repeat protein [Chloroflexota bacterium]
MTNNQRGLSLEQVERFLVRLGLIGGAVLCFYVATMLWESADVVRQTFSLVLVIVAYLVAFGLIIAASLRALPYRAIWIIPVVLTLALVGFARNRDVNQIQNTSITTSDVYMISDYSAHLVRLGQNPYMTDLGDAYRVYRASSTLQTPTTDGNFIGKMVYPALAFLLFVPFQLLGIPTNLVFALFYWLTMIVIFIGAPRIVRPVILLPLFIEPRYIFYAIGGVSDTVWAFLICLMILSWRNKKLSAVWFGLACAFKQQPWLLVPFLAIRLLRESPEDERTFRLLDVLEFFLIAGGVFALINLPYILWDFPSWLAGSVSPFFDRMITLGQGLSSLTTEGVVFIPRTMYTIYMGLAYAVSIFIYWRHYHSLKSLIWLFPGLALWLGQRSLSSYWYFNLMPFILGLAHDTLPWATVSPLRFRSWRPTAAVVGGAAAFILVTVIAYKAAGTPLTLAVQRPIQTDGTTINHLTVQITNSSSQPINPRFSVQSWPNQPLFWDIQDGPDSLPAGGHAFYRISTTMPGEMLDMARGGQIIVTDAANDGLRASEILSGDTGFISMDGIPNGTFEYQDRFTGAPALWGLVTVPAESGAKAALVDSDRFGHALRLTLQPSTTDTRAVAMLDTWLTMPEAPLSVWVNPPPDANRAPDFDLVYGLELLSTFDNQRAWVLFGDTQSSGEIEPGLPYLMLPAPRDQWSQQAIDPRAIFGMLGITIAPPQPIQTRFDSLDFPKQMVNFRLLLAARRGSSALIDADFGPIAAAQNRADPGTLIEQDVVNPLPIDIMRGEFNRAVHNDAPAAAYYRSALNLNPNSAEAYYGLGEIALRAEHWPEAISNFEAALRLNFVRDALSHSGLAWAYDQQGDLDAAQTHADAALRAMKERVFFYNADTIAGMYRVSGWVALDQGRYDDAQSAFSEVLRNDDRDSNAYFGLALVRLALKDSAGATNALHTAFELGWNGPLPKAACAQSPALAPLLGLDVATLSESCAGR